MKNKIWLRVIAASVCSSVITFFLVVLFYTPRLSTSVVEAECIGQDCTNADAIQIALQLGRLDIVSLCLALLGISVALFAIIGFFAVKEKAEMEAKGVAENITKDWLVNNAPRLIGQHFSELMKLYEEQMTDEVADDIAGAFVDDNGPTRE